MATANISQQQILDAVKDVPPERWPEILAAIKTLRAPVTTDRKNPVHTGIDLRGSELIGIWSDRSDLGDGHQFARHLRHQSEQRQPGPTNAAGH
jgi:hypothetical protein